MEQPPELTPQEIYNMQQHHLGQPQTVKIFGILHVILAAYGLLTSVFAVYVVVVGNPFLALMPKNPAMAAQAELQAEMQQKIMPASVITTVVTLILAVLLLIAGIKLLKKRKNALKWSNRYAWTSLAGKAVNLVLAFTYTIPMTKEMMAAMSPATPGMPGAVGGVMVVTTILGILVMCTYPILTLTLLNRPNVKEWFAAQPD